MPASSASCPGAPKAPCAGLHPPGTCDAPSKAEGTQLERRAPVGHRMKEKQAPWFPRMLLGPKLQVGRGGDGVGGTSGLLSGARGSSSPVLSGGPPITHLEP